MNGNHHVLAYADDVNLIGDYIRIKRKTGVLLNDSKDIGLALKTGKTRYMKVGRLRDQMANEHTMIGKSKIFEYVGSLLTKQNSIHETIKCVTKQKICVIIESKHFVF